MSSPNMQITRSKTVNETISVIADFSDDLIGGETITEWTSAAFLFSGTDLNPETILYQVPELHGSKVEQRIKQGVPGNIYSIDITASTTAGHVYEWTTRLAVLPNTGTAIPIFGNYNVTSQPYPLNDTEVYQSPSINVLSGILAFQPYLGPENTRGYTLITDIQLLGSAVSYANPPEYTRGITLLTDITIIGVGVSYSIPFESTHGVTALLSIYVYGNSVAYTIPFESTRGTTLLTDVTIT